MAVRLTGRHFISLLDYTTEEIHQIIEFACRLKQDVLAGRRDPLLRGRVLGMIFQKPSTRTRVSFEAGMAQLGGSAIYLSSRDIQLSRGESVADTARVLSRFCDGIVARVFGHEDVVELAKHSRVPVINGLSDFNHPVQILCDLMTLHEKRRRLAGLRVAYIGDGNNVAHSWIKGAAKVGIDLRIATPAGYEPRPEVARSVQADFTRTGGRVTATRDPIAAVKDADVIYTDVWASMGQESEHDARVKIFQPYQVNGRLLEAAAPGCQVMHCLPAHRGEEITDEVIDGPASIVFDQAENRLHGQKALLCMLMG